MSPPLNRSTVVLLAILLEAFEHKLDLDGWQLAKALHRPGPVVYAALDQLEAAGWIAGEWEQRDPKAKPQPRRRFYRLTGAGVEAARARAAEEIKGRQVLRPRLGLGPLLGVRS